MNDSAADLESLVPPLLALCARAGQLIEARYHAPGADEFHAKGDDSPLTLADLDSHHCLQAGLAELTPALPLLSEESSREELAQRRSWREFWLVDPLDGTKEFLGRTGEFTINVALVREHRAVLGIIYLPLARVAYVGIPGRWARRYRAPSWSHERIGTRALRDDRPLLVLASRRHRGRRLLAALDWLERRRGPLERDNSGSALKFCHLAEGLGDLYPRFSPCSEWDTAAGQALLEAAGGALLGLDGQPLSYNRRASLLSPDFLALADPASPLWGDLLAELPRA